MAGVLLAALLVLATGDHWVRVWHKQIPTGQDGSPCPSSP